MAPGPGAATEPYQSHTYMTMKILCMFVYDVS
jgi:hypothetical protein